MFDIKSLIYSKFNFLPSFCSLGTYIKITGERIIIPVYHVVSNQYLPHIANLYQYGGVKKFKKDLDYLLKYYKPLDVFDLMRYVYGEKNLQYNSFHLTFDDGLQEFYSDIAPILKQKGIPATCFINSDFLDNKDIFFRYKVSLIIDAVKNVKLSADRETQLKLWFEKNNLRSAPPAKSFLSIGYNKKHILNEPAEILEINFDTYLKTKKPYLSIQQVNELIGDGFTFGAHSIDHPEYRFLTLAEQLFQTTRSIEAIVKKFGLSYKLFAFPFTDYGVSSAFFQQIKSRSVADLTFGCAGLKHDIFSFNLQRIPMEDFNLPASRRLKTDYFYFIIKAPLGKNKIHRN
ncbi:MAG: polysaccharide deacetylase family protein [Bacteroidales bacterium]|nr:polysaccharide deacetylase family protein [Bacteroidales bacterium]